MLFASRGYHGAHTIPRSLRYAAKRPVSYTHLLIDFTENGTSAQDNKLFEANPGGAPCNVLAMLQKLGHQTAFIGKVGQDAFGRLLVDAVKEQGIDTTGVRYDDNVHTLSLIHI